MNWKTGTTLFEVQACQTSPVCTCRISVHVISLYGRRGPSSFLSVSYPLGVPVRPHVVGPIELLQHKLTRETFPNWWQWLEARPGSPNFETKAPDREITRQLLSLDLRGRRQVLCQANSYQFSPWLADSTPLVNCRRWHRGNVEFPRLEVDLQYFNPSCIAASSLHTMPVPVDGSTASMRLPLEISASLVNFGGVVFVPTGKFWVLTP